MEIVRTEGLKKYFVNGDYEVRALDGVDISIEEGNLRHWWEAPARERARF